MVAVPRRVGLFIAGLLPIMVLASCGPSQAPAATVDAGIEAEADAGHTTPDSGPPVTSGFDANDFPPPADAGEEDAGRDEDAGKEDAGHRDGGAAHDAGTPDASVEPDAGVERDAGEEDAGTPDAGHSGRADAGHVDAGCVPWTDQYICENKGKKCGTYMITDNCGGPRDETCFNACPTLLAEGDFLLDGVTSDGNIVVTSRTNGDVSFISVLQPDAGLANISTHGTSPVVEVSNTEAFIWYATDAGPGTTLPVGTMYTWDSSDSTKGPVDGGTLVSAALASPSEGELFYFGSVNEGTKTGTLVAAGSDLSAPKDLLSSIYLPPMVANFGAVAGFSSYGIVLAHRLSTSTDTTLTTWNATSNWASTDVGLEIGGPFWADSDGNITWLSSSDTLSQWTPGPPHATKAIATMVAPEILGTENATAWISSDSSTVAYVSGGTLYAATGSPFMSMGLDNGVAAVLGLDPGGDEVLYAKSLTAASSCSDLWMSPTATSMMTMQIGAGTCALYGSVQFTQDYSTVVYIDGPSAGAGTVTSFAVDGSSPTETWGSGGATSITPVDTTIIVFTDGVVPSNTSGVPPTVDVEQADVSSTSFATVAGKVDGSYVVSTSTGQGLLVYTVSSTTVGSTATKGLYLVTLP